MPQAIQCYQDQSYPHRELLIVSDGIDVRDLLPLDRSIRLIHIEEGRPIGEKRNFGVSRARGQIIAHWDDDDWSAPQRLSDQIERLEHSGKAVTGYHSMRFTDGERWWQYRADSDKYAIGTSLCFRRSWWEANPFPRIQIGEDSEFSERAAVSGELIAVDAGKLMHATIHPGNSSPRLLLEHQWSQLCV